jgi:hypothetical protein
VVGAGCTRCSLPVELESAWWFRPLNLKCDILVSKLAFKFSTRTATMWWGLMVANTNKICGFGMEFAAGWGCTS